MPTHPHCGVSCGAASPALVKLGIAAGCYSRFHADPGIPKDAADALYAIWTEQSARRELAAMVFVARPEDGDNILGVVTVQERDDVGRMGLLAVDKAVRGAGIGEALLRCAPLDGRTRITAGRGSHPEDPTTKRAPSMNGPAIASAGSNSSITFGRRRETVHERRTNGAIGGHSGIPFRHDAM